MNRSTIILSILLGIMTVVSLLLFFSLGYLELDYEYSYNQLDSEWCETSNNHVELTNLLIFELKDNLEGYDDLEYLDIPEC